MTGWLDRLPSTWSASDPRRYFRERREPSRQGDVHLTPSQHYGVLAQADYMAQSGTKVVLNLSAPDTMKHVEPSDFIAHLRSFQGGLEKSDLGGKVSTAYTVIEPLSAVDPRYYRWVFKSQGYIQALSASLEQLRDGQSIKFADFARIRVPRPPDSEQRRIADFLDDRVARIDQIITARRRQQQESAAWFMAAMQQEFDDLAGTYGTGRLGYLLRGLEQGWSPQADASPAGHGEWGVMRSGCVNDGAFRADDNKRLPDGLEPQRRYEIEAGDLLMSRASGSLDKIGSVAVVPDGVRNKLLLCDKIYRATPASGWSAHYLAYMLGAHRNRELIRLGVSGADGMANNLPSGVVRSLQIPLASPAAQEATAARALDRREQRMVLDQGITKSVALLTEYKQSLITAAVTGELDVTTAGSGIPG